jgi:3-hydroxypropionyl-CoA synthetase (ADP-forming)
MHKRLQRWQKTLQRANAPDEWEVKQLLAMLDIDVPEGIRIRPAQKIPRPRFDPPYVVKICQPSLIHKTDHQAVELNVGRHDLKKVVRVFFDRFQDSAVLIEKQILFEGPELILGALCDASFGPAVMAGAGGILTELYRDVAFRLAPCSAREAKRMLAELTLAPVLKGFRGLKLDPAKLADIIAKISELAVHLEPQLGQFDINPIVFSNGRWVILDAKLVFKTDRQTSDQ